MVAPESFFLIFFMTPPDEEDDDNKYKKLASEQPSYQQVDGVWTDVWSVIDMTESERTEKDTFLENRRVREIPVSEP